MKISDIAIGPLECRNISQEAQTDKLGNVTQRCNFCWMGGEKTWKVPSHLTAKFQVGDVVQLVFQVEKLTVMPQQLRGDDGVINYNDIFAKLAIVNEVKVAKGSRDQ